MGRMGAPKQDPEGGENEFLGQARDEASSLGAMDKNWTGKTTLSDVSVSTFFFYENEIAFEKAGSEDATLTKI
jgi:hypothetical protein